jgi:DNA-directed RNA polymerase subunit L
MFSTISSDPKDPTQLKFRIDNIDVSLVNAIRRSVIADVETVAISFDPNKKNEDIIINTNTGALHNEFLSHRLSLLPIHLSRKEIVDFEKGPNEYSYHLHVKNETSTMLDVTTADIIVKDETRNDNKGLTKRLFPANAISGDYILITRLKPNLYEEGNGDEIEIEARASKGCGSMHSRWCPVSKCCFYNVVDEEAANKSLEEKLNEAQSNEKKSQILKRFNAIERDRHFIKNEFDEPCSFWFELQTECALTPQEVFLMGVDKVLERVERFSQNIVAENDIDIKQQAGGMFMIDVENEGHTLGNLIQVGLYNHLVRNQQDISYIGYYEPHPLENHIIFKVKLTDDKATKDKMKQVIHEGCELILKDLRDIRSEWINATNIQ